MTKDQNFISAVVAVEDRAGEPMNFFETLYQILDEHFLQFEIIVVNRDLPDGEKNELRQWGRSVEKPVSMIHMSLQQPLEQCMNAGLDCAIGDYIYEFDSTAMPYDPGLIWKAYQLSQEGNDIVTVCPSKEKPASRLFYSVFNANSNAVYPLRTDAFRLVSRRALNRAHAITDNLPYRKAAYATCGMKMTELIFPGIMKGNSVNRLEKATDSLVLYTDFGYKFSIGLTLLMFIAALAELVYTLIVWRTGHPIAGWTTSMFVLTLGFTGLFSVLAILLKYMTLLLRIVFHKQNYLIESIEKL